MPFGMLTPEMEAALRPFVEGQTVWDLGAGDLTYAQKLLELGAARVWAVDKRIPYGEIPERITFIKGYFQNIHELGVPISTLFLSWPCNASMAVPGLPTLARGVETVIYLGHNLDGTCCGTWPLWHDLTHREVLAHIPHPRNSFIVYGKPCGERPLLPEEHGAASASILSYEDAREMAQNSASSSLS